MSTRSIILITGKSRYGDPGTIRLYKHSDGYPTGTLGVIQAALAKSINQQREYAERFKEPKPDPVGVEQVVGNLIGESTTVHGQGARVEESFEEPFEPNHLGNQSDLEWIYLVDLDSNAVKIFGGGYTGQRPQAALKLGPVNPEQYAKDLRAECQAGKIEETNRLVESIKAIGFSVNANQPTKPTKKRGSK